MPRALGHPPRYAPEFRFSTRGRTGRAHGLATLTKLKSGSWRAQIRRKGHYVNETSLRRKEAEERALDMERRIDRQEPTVTRRSRDAKRFRDLVALHRQDMAEVGIRIGRSKDFCLTAIDEALGALLDAVAMTKRSPDCNRARAMGELMPAECQCRSVRPIGANRATSTNLPLDRSWSNVPTLGSRTTRMARHRVLTTNGRFSPVQRRQYFKFVSF